jgi:hypothetical protein
VKTQTRWLVATGVVMVAGAGAWYFSRRGAAPAAATAATTTGATTAAGAANPTNARAGGAPTVQAGTRGQATALPDGKTVDMSTGRPIVRDDEASARAIDRDLHEMRAAAQRVMFEANQNLPGKKERAETPPAPPAPKP